MTTVTYLVPNISCHHCVHTIEMEVGELSGVIDVHGDESSKNVTITFDAPASTAKIEALLQELDYPVSK